MVGNIEELRLVAICIKSIIEIGYRHSSFFCRSGMLCLDSLHHFIFQFGYYDPIYVRVEVYCSLFCFCAVIIIKVTSNEMACLKSSIQHGWNCCSCVFVAYMDFMFNEEPCVTWPLGDRNWDWYQLLLRLVPSGGKIMVYSTASFLIMLWMWTVDVLPYWCDNLCLELNK